MQIIKDDAGVVVGFVGESGMSEHSVDMLEEAIKNDKLSDEMLVVSDEKIGAEFMNKAKGLGLNVVHCLSDLEDCSPMQKEAILANCDTKILLKNYRIGKTVTMEKQLKDTIENGTGIAYVDRKGQKVEILPFAPSSELPRTVIAQSGAGMSYFEQGNELSKLTIVLQSYDIFGEQNEHFLRKCRLFGVSCFLIPSDTCELGHPVKSKKQPDYRKFEKNKRF